MVSVLCKTRCRRTLALGLAGLAALGFVLEILVVEEVLFSRCEYEICSAIYALENAVLKLRHSTVPRYQPEHCCRIQAGAAPRPAPALRSVLFDFPASLLPVSFAGQRLLDPELLTRLQVEGVTLHFLNNVLLLDFTLEAAKGVF